MLRKLHLLVTHKYYYGTGQGTTTRPFGDTTNFPNAWCGGGAGGGRLLSGANTQKGGNGGTNGGSGGSGSNVATAPSVGGTGGATGGGDGGSASTDWEVLAGRPGYMYGGGGGGGGYIYSTTLTPNYRQGEPGDGYQGIVIVRVPI